jgi:uncharacterized membrane protein (DUF106 family)
MENIEIHLYFIYSIVILSFLLPFILLILNTIDRSRLSKIDSFQEFKGKMKIMIIRKLSKSKETFTIEEITEEAMRGERMVKKAKRLLFITLPVLIFIFYILLLENILRYYTELKSGYRSPLRFPLADIVDLIALSLWISAFLFTKLAEARVNMFHKKLKELQNK